MLGAMVLPALVDMYPFGQGSRPAPGAPNPDGTLSRNFVNGRARSKESLVGRGVRLRKG
jgi:hypothetical protein